MADNTTGDDSPHGRTMIIDDGRLPEEQPETPWDISHGVRMASSSLEAIESTESPHRAHDVAVRFTDDNARRAEARVGAEVLRIATADLPAHGPLTQTLKQVATTLTSREFAERLSRSTGIVATPSDR